MLAVVLVVRTAGLNLDRITLGLLIIALGLLVFPLMFLAML